MAMHTLAAARGIKTHTYLSHLLPRLGSSGCVHLALACAQLVHARGPPGGTNLITVSMRIRSNGDSEPTRVSPAACQFRQAPRVPVSDESSPGGAKRRRYLRGEDGVGTGKKKNQLKGIRRQSSNPVPRCAEDA